MEVWGWVALNASLRRLRTIGESSTSYRFGYLLFILGVHKVMTIQPAISVHHVDHFFGSGKLRRQALFDIDLEISSGEIVYNLHGSLTAVENVQMGLEVQDRVPRKERYALAIKMLGQVGLGDRINYYPADLSGGQKQRGAIALALVNNPKIVLADEPTAALHKKSGRDVVEIMYDLAKKQGCTILLVTQDNRILNIADRIVYMEDERLALYPELVEVGAG